MFARTARSFLVSVIMFYSLKNLRFSQHATIVASLIPLILGSIGIFVPFAYMLTGVCFIVACGSAVLPELNFGAKTVGDLAKAGLAWVSAR